jgi:predicted ATPase
VGGRAELKGGLCRSPGFLLCSHSLPPSYSPPMPFLTEVHFQNYRSFLDAKCRLSPVTAVIGANNAGKSNFLRGLGLCVASSGLPGVAADGSRNCHRSRSLIEDKTEILLSSPHGQMQIDYLHGDTVGSFGTNGGVGLSTCGLYRLNADQIGAAESDTERPIVHTSGEGVTRVLQWLSLKKKRSFLALEEEFQKFVPEIEELTFERADQGKWFLQVKERGIEALASLSEMSEGTRTILALLTILYQPNRPDLILLEDIEHAIHPRGLKPLVEKMRRISKEHGVQIIFTTQSPYVLDAFQEPEHWDAVVIVEKKDGVSTLTNARERLVALGYEREMDKVPLGDLWYSGLLGGVAGPNELWDEKEPKS